MSIKYFLLPATFLIFLTPAQAQTQQPTLSGYVRDAQTGGPLAGAAVYVREAKRYTIANAEGFYSIPLPAGAYSVTASYMGYRQQEEALSVKYSLTKNFALRQQDTELEEVVVSAERHANVAKAEMGVEKLEIKTIKRIPALMGEVDVIKAIMLLPGVQPAAEGTSAFSVRGGSPDQNLILFDNATVYNASHLMGFFSVFNNDVVNDVKLYKGDIPATHGGRLSSLLEVNTKTGDADKFNVNGGIGLISSRLEVDGPIIDRNLTFVAAGRRTYADLFLPLAPEERVRDAVLHFYDLNGKLSYKLNDKNRITLAGYYGSDVFGMPVAGMDFINSTYSLNWNHLYSDKLFSNISIIGSGYRYKLKMAISGFDMQWQSAIDDLGVRADFTKLYGDENLLRFGVTSVWHKVNPCDAYAQTPISSAPEFIRLPEVNSLESSAYIMNQHKIGERLTVKYGLRGTMFSSIGPATVYNYDQSYNLLANDTSRTYSRGDFYNTYWRLEPRAGAVFLLGNNNSIKASYSRTVQYMHLISNSTATSPLDVWMPSSPNIKPQSAHQASAGYFHNLANDAVELSGELFYKYMSDVVDYKDHAAVMMNQKLEGELRRGIGRSYGVELMARKNTGKFTGWISYTYSRSFRKVQTVNNDEWYQAPFDRPHNLNIVASYDITRRLNLSANWTFSSGTPTTFPEGRYVAAGTSIPIYGKRNTYRLDDYHRLDVALNFELKKRGRYSHEINLSLYNAYARHNTWFIQFTEEPENSGIMYADKLYLFSVVPSVTYNFKF
ncbi:MAG: TonB-dependent receptor [Prevotellaceae bacterium]|jgi:hypothetical protein|nr:TonB-dependent receptor [Prevotellaceae bacterium]